jgi:hypothetical protein
MTEYVCADGRMSVNGICSILNQNNDNNNIIPTKTFDQKYESIEDIPIKDYSKDVKSNFQWDFDKVGNKIGNFGDTVKGNIGAYDDYVENEFGIPKEISYGARAVGVGVGVSTYGAVGALVPFAIPFLVGGALNKKQKKENERITNITNRDTQGDISTIDMTTYGIPTYGDVGFNIHNDAGDNNNQSNNVGGGTFGDSVNDNSSFSDYS